MIFPTLLLISLIALTIQTFRAWFWKKAASKMTERVLSTVIRDAVNKVPQSEWPEILER